MRLTKSHRKEINRLNGEATGDLDKEKRENWTITWEEDDGPDYL